MVYLTKLMVGLITLLLSILFISPAFQKAPSQRIYSQRIQSEDPLVVATNFIEAWRRNDFYETWQLLTPATNRNFSRILQ
ncbi:hypothetical protein [Citrobacter farmeri]|uniref:hypothetical protein n=1 Tax=Citrobacter farmeri TaxID=67824 RepID=UPI00292E6D6C|nr:hypothetical protein [Citrobacter farmeri]